MGAAKERFLKDREMSEKLRACTHADWFKNALMFASAVLMERSDITVDELRGAKKLEAALLDLGDPEEKPSPFPNSGLDHNLDIEPRDKPTEKKKA